MSNKEIHDDELEGLSDEERAALEEEEDETLVDSEEEEDLDDEDEDEDEEGDPEEDPEELDNEEDDDPDTAPAPVDKKDSEPEDDEGFTPQYQAEPVEGYDYKMKDIADRKKELRQQYKDGDLDLDEYEDQRDAIEDEALQLREANLKATMSAEQSQQAGAQRWQWEQDRFFRVEKNKIYQDDPLIGSAFDTAVRSLGNDEKNSNRPMSWFLEEADRMIRERFTIPAGKDTDKDKGKQNKRRHSDKRKIPPNLGDLPAADIAETGGSDEFAKLEKLDGMELEKALSKMSDAEQERYLKGK